MVKIDEHLNDIRGILNKMASDGHFNSVRVGIKKAALDYALSELEEALNEELREQNEDIET